MELDSAGKDLLFRNARSQNGWHDKPVSEAQLRQIYDLMKWGPTSANCSPARILFLITRAAKERLRPALLSANIDKTMSAPAVALIGYDLKFYDLLPRLFPHNPGARTGTPADPPRPPAHPAHRRGAAHGCADRAHTPWRPTHSAACPAHGHPGSARSR